MELPENNAALERRVTERTAALETANNTLRASEERFELAVRGSSDSIWDWGIAEGKSYFSERWWALLGYGPDETSIGPEGLIARIHTDDAERVCSPL